MKFQFSIREAVRDSWHMFWRHVWFFGGMAAITFLLSLFKSEHHIVVTTLVIIAQVLWGYVWLSTSLAAADDKEDILHFKYLSSHMPNFRQFLTLIGIGIVTAIIVVVGLVLLIIPGLYFAIRLAFAQLAYVDHQDGVKKSLERSWHMVKGKIFWTVVLVALVQVGILIVGFLALFIGLLVAYPLTMLVYARFYRALDTHHRTMATEPVTAPTPAVEMNTAEPA